ncbi:Pr6Pr family membrane protein [Pseudomonas sp. CDFA 602]|uniref:Pr6Pr family membrane protein n=1 Tax=Pseudomonas californiensis TaxID=2829823 RepID=UPI001E495F58|nr:Pr6Pr family membrane protein [Pseudomonas californiensis]MCD5995123.1 Pr6Pr family membrane protein [Pseudomonas californiensis]MCD6000791.1 Pr6Pr family membrane protein [Pseudomonas californiensis]
MYSSPSRPAQGQRYFTLVAACLGWSGLVIQLYLIFIGRYADHASLLGGLVRFFSFFTVLTNTLVVVALTCALNERQSAGHRFFRHPVVCSGIAASIALVGIAYNVLLRHLWQPQGWQWVADELLHDVMPLAFLLYWWLYVPKGTLRLGHLGLWMLYPIAYFAYILLRGDVIGDYMYPFIDVGTIGYPKAFINALGVLAGFLMIALVLLGIDKWAARRKR